MKELPTTTDMPEKSNTTETLSKEKASERLSSRDLFSVFDDRRLEELDELLRFVRIAGNLNHGSGVADKINELEVMARKMETHDWKTPRQGFLEWLRSYLNENLPENV